MSLNVSLEIEARIAANAQDAGVSIDTYLERVVEEDEAITALVAQADARRPALSRQEVSAKIERGLTQLERGDCVDGEQFMAELMTDLDSRERAPQGG
jgi:hypothetical protein